jgi:hypothetical protein
MAWASPDLDRPYPRDGRVLGFLLLSLLLHGLWLALPLEKRASPGPVSPPPSLAVQLVQPPAPREIMIDQPSPRPRRRTRDDTPRPQDTSSTDAATTVLSDRVPASTSQRQHTGIDLETAYAAARSIAKDTKPPSTIGSPALPLTVEAAVAKATKPDTVIESRGANGEWVTQDRKTRCVARIQRKWFEEGVPMLTLCEVKKG